MSPTLRKVAAVGLFLIAAFMLLGFSVSEETHSAGVLVFSLLLTVALGLWRSAPRNNAARIQQLRDQTIDAEILRLAIERNGRLTAVEIMSTLGLPEADVSRSLDGMMTREVADMEVSEDGVLVYTFHDAKYVNGDTDATRLRANGGTDAKKLHVDGGVEAKRVRDG
jgi:hypothetical protein